MDTLAIDESLDSLEQEIRQKYAGVNFEFSNRVFKGHAELLVYVLTLDQFEAVKKECQLMAEKSENLPFPIWIFAKTWTGPWPGGEGLAKIKQRRQEFLNKYNSMVK